MKIFLRTLCTFSILIWFSNIRSCKLGCALASPAAHLCLIACIRQDISATLFCSCTLLWRSDECVLLSYFNISIAACLESCKGAEHWPTIYSWLVYDILVLYFKRQPLSAGWYVFLYKVRAFRTCL